VIRIELVSEDALPSLRGQWDALVARGDDPRPYSRHSWLLARRRHFGRGHLLTVTAWRGDELVGALPLELTHRRGVTSALMVDGARGGYSDLLVAEGDTEAAGALADALPGLGADLLTTPMYREGSAAEQILESRGMVRMPSLDSLRRMAVDAPWPEVEARHISGRTRKDRRRRERRLRELGSLEHELLRDPAEVARAIPDAVRLHRLRWPPGLDGSALGTAAGVAFWADVTVRLAREGLVRMFVVRFDGRMIAFELALLLERRLSTYRGQFDPEFRSHGVGTLATMAMLAAVTTAEPVELVEFGPGEEAWKEDLATEALALPAGLLPLSARGRAEVARRVALGHARRRLKEVELAQRARAYVHARRAAH
jgi:CelD/BcsL family acetyltransferase involved in cellulose biosynthesis